MPEKKQIKKFIGVPLEKGYTRNEEGHLVARGFFTSDKEDVLGDIITKKATEGAVDAYRQWGNIRYMHQPRPVGKVIGIGKSDGLKWNEVEFKVVDKDAAYEVEQGLLSALSVGILVQWDDIELTEEGGFKILAYQLAEISLVDHPANYDATLKGVQATEGLRYLAQEYGFETVAREMASLLNIKMEGNMPKNEEAVIEEEKDLSAETEEEVEAEAETEEVEEGASEEVEAEKDLDAESDTEEVDAEAEEEAETEEEEVAIEASMAEAFSKFAAGFEKFASLIEAQNERLDRVLESLETPAEDQGTDQSEGDDEVEAEDQESEKSVDDEGDDDETAAVNRDGQIAPTDTMDLSEVDEDLSVSIDLKQSLRRFFKIDQEVEV